MSVSFCRMPADFFIQKINTQGIMLCNFDRQQPFLLNFIQVRRRLSVNGFQKPQNIDKIYSSLHLKTVFFKDEICGNAAGFIDGRQAAAGMGSATHQKTVFKFFKLVVGP